MLSITLGLCLALWHETVAATPREKLFPKCISECAVTGLQKLYYIPGHSYTYAYSGKSLVKVEGIQDAQTDIQWHMDVVFDWTNTCDVIMNIKNPVVMGTKDKEMSDLLTNYPLIFTMSEGVVQGVCSHPHEDPFSLNLKKGIISALQNTLPSLSVIHTEKTYKEFDVLGKCPTHYTVQASNSKYIITKFKNHVECSNKYSDDSQSVLNTIIRKSSYPIMSSSSLCVQEVQNGIIESVKCEDNKEIKPLVSSSKYVSTKQISELSFKQKTVSKVPILNITEFSQTNLELETYLHPHLKENVPHVRKLLEDICLKTTTKVENDVPYLVNKLRKNLNKIPTDNFIKIFDDIKSQKFCSTNAHLKTIFMDVIAYVDHEAAIKIMIDEIINGNLTGLRSELFVTSLFITKTITDKTIEYLEPVFQSDQHIPSLMLASGSLIRKYCKSNENCYNLQPVIKIFKILTDSLKRSCFKRNIDNDLRYKLLSIFKTIGNIGKISDGLEEEILKCIHYSHLNSVVRASAIQSFRLQPCSKKNVEVFLNMILNKNEKTEIRIESFLNVIRCPSLENVERILNMVRHEDTEDEVRSYIVSYIYNGVNSQYPSFENLKHIFRNNLIPFIYSVTSSRNINFGYFAKNLGIGFDFNKNFIFDLKKNFQRYDESFSYAYLNKINNLFDISSRIKNSLPSNFFEDTWYKMDSENLELKQLKLYAKSIFLNLLNRIGSQSTESSSENSNIKDTGQHQWDAYIRLFDTEIFFLSLHNGISELREANLKPVNDEIRKALRKLKEYFTLKDLNATRVLFAGFEIFLPTVQGIPLAIKWDSTTLFGLNIKTKSTRSAKVKYIDNEVIDTPEFSSESSGFLGFSFGAKVGVKNKININLLPELTSTYSKKSENKLTFSLQTSESKANVLNIISDTYLFQKRITGDDIKIIPKSFIDSRKVVNHSCLPPKDASGIGVKVCWNFNISDVLSSKIFPFGFPSEATIYVEVDNPEAEALNLNSLWQIEDESSLLQLELESIGGPKVQRAGGIAFNATTLSHFKSLQMTTSGKNGMTSFGLKMILENKTTKASSKNKVSVFASTSTNFSTNNKILSVTYESQNENSRKPNVDFKLQTLNNLAEIINANIKVLADIRCKTSETHSEHQQRIKESLQYLLREFSSNVTYRFLRVPLEKTLGFPLKKTLTDIPVGDIFSFPFEVTVHNMEVKLGSGDLQTETTLKTLTHEEKSSQYKILTKLEGGKSLGGVKVIGFIAFRGIMEENLALTSKFNGKIGNSNEYQTEAFIKHDTLHGTIFSIDAENVSKKSKLALLKYSRMFTTKTVLKENAEVFLVGYIPHYQIDGIVTEKQNGEYALSYNIKREGNPSLHIEGPISVSITPEKAEEQANLTITGLQGGIYKVFAGYSLSSKKSRLFLDLSQSSNEIAYIKFYLNHPNHDETQGACELRIPSLINIDFDAENTLKLLQTNIVIQILPNSSLERTIKGQSHMNYHDKKIQANFACEDHRNDVKKIFVETKYDISTENRSYLLDGDLRTPTGTFSYDLKFNLGVPTEKSTFKHLLIKLTKPTKQSFTMELLYHNNVFNANVGDVTGLVKVKTLTKHSYQFGSNFCYAFEPISKKVEVAGQINITCPGVEDLIIKVDSLSTMAQERSHDLETRSSSSINEKESRSVTSKIQYNTDIIPYIEKDFRIRIEALLPSKSLQNATFYFEKNSTKNKIIFESFKNFEQFISFHSEVLNDSAGLLSLFTSSRRIDVTTKLLSRESSLTLYPNKEWSASDYHSVGGRYIKGSKYIYEDEAIRQSIKQYKNLNSMQNKVNFLAHVAIPQTSMTGAIELNLNNDHYEKISVSIESIELSKGSFKTEMIFRSPSFASNPRILVESSFTSFVKSLTISFQHEVSVPPSLSISGTYSSVTEDQTNFYYFVKTPKAELEFTSTLDEKYEFILPFTSLIFNLNGTLRSSNGMYDFASAFCRPAYFEFGTNKRGERYTYMSKVGSQQEFSLIGIDQRSSNDSLQVCLKSNEFDKEVVKASISLYTQMILQFQAYYDIPNFINFMQQIKNSYTTVISVTSELAENIWDEMFNKLLHKDSIQLKSSLKGIFQDIRRKLKQIYDKLKSESWLPNFFEWGEKIKNFLTKLIDSYKEMLSHLRKLFAASINKLMEDILKAFDQLDKMVKSSLRKLIDYVQKVKNCLQNLLSDWETLEFLLKYISPSNLWKLLEKYWSLIFGHFRTELEIVEDFAQNVYSIVKQEFNYIWDILIASNPIIQNYVGGAVEWAYGDEPTRTILKKIFTIDFGNNKGSFDLKLPLRSPSHSIRSALVQIGIPGNMARYYFRVPMTNINLWHEIMFRKKNKQHK